MPVPKQIGKDCPRCHKPLTGPKCRHCGLDTHEADIVRCSDCGDRTTKEVAKEVRTQKDISARWVTKYYCQGCA